MNHIIFIIFFLFSYLEGSATQEQNEVENSIQTKKREEKRVEENQLEKKQEEARWEEKLQENRRRDLYEQRKREERRRIERRLEERRLEDRRTILVSNCINSYTLGCVNLHLIKIIITKSLNSLL